MCLVAVAAGIMAAFLPGAFATERQPPVSRHIDVDLSAPAGPVDRFFDLSIGSDYPGTLMRADSQMQLQLVAHELGFRYVRFHAIFHDVLGTVRSQNGVVSYDWSKLDRSTTICWRNRSGRSSSSASRHRCWPLHATAFSTGTATRHTPTQGAARLITAFIRHIEERYGRDEVRSWYFEVWNEPNLAGFWEGADQQAYFALYDLTSKSIKSVDPKLRVGGPATAGAAWIPEFLAHVKESGAAVDFVTTHTYGVDGGFLDEDGKSDTKLSAAPDAIVGDVRRVRQEISKSPFPDCRCTSPNGARAIRRGMPYMIYISAAYILSKAESLCGPGTGHELLDLHGPVRGARATNCVIPGRFRAAEP